MTAAKKPSLTAAMLLIALLWLALPVRSAELANAYSAMRQGDFARAAGIFEAAAEAGSVEAQYQLGKLYLVGRDYHWITRRLCEQADKTAEGRVVSSLEGGYDLHALARSVEAHLKAFLGEH